MNDTILKDMLSLNTAPGKEKPMADYLLSFFASVGETAVDALGNVRVTIGSGGKTHAFLAHMDAPGLAVTFLEEDGRVRVSPLGKFKAADAAGKRVSANGSVGVFVPADAENGKIEDGYVDFGFPSRDEARKTVEQGDVLAFCEDVTALPDGTVYGVGTGTKACAAALAMAALAVAEDKREDTCVFLFTVQSKLGWRGDAVAPFAVQPDEVIAVEPYAGKGLASLAADASTVCDEHIRESLAKAAEQAGVCLSGVATAESVTGAGIAARSGIGCRAGALLLGQTAVTGLVQKISTSDVKKLADVLVKCFA